MKDKNIYILTTGWPVYKIVSVFDNQKTPLKIKNKHNKKYFDKLDIEKFILNKID